MKKHVYVHEKIFPGHDLGMGGFYRLTMVIKCFDHRKRVLRERRAVRRKHAY